MKILIYGFLMLTIIACKGPKTELTSLVSQHPYLLGQWEGTGHFLNVNLNKSMGEIAFDIKIKNDDVILGKVGDANFINTSIKEADYGFVITGFLDAKLMKTHENEKRHLSILLILPEENRDTVSASIADFHVKSNTIFDFGMQVGGVLLKKNSQ